MLLRKWVLVLLVLWLADAGAGAASGPAILLHARSYQPGEAILAEVSAASPLANLEIRAFGRSFPGFAADDGRNWQALVGIDLATPPGRYRLEFLGKSVTNEPVDVRREITVLPKSFPTRRLTVEEKYAQPPAEELERIAAEAKRVESIIASVTAERFWSGAFVVPVPGAPISNFGKRTLVNGQARSPHSGTDFSGSTGTPIKAPAGGRVVLSADLYFSGNTIILDHGLGVYSFLAHLSQVAVKEGAPVQRGEFIGRVGATGRVTGPHLHWTLRLCGTRIDPLSLIEVLKESR